MPLLRLIKSVVEVALIYHKTLRDFNKNNWGGGGGGGGVGGGWKGQRFPGKFPTESTNVSIESCMYRTLYLNGFNS